MSCKHLIDAPGTILLASNKAYLSWGIINVLLHVVLGGDTRTLYADSWPGLCATGTRQSPINFQAGSTYLHLPENLEPRVRLPIANNITAKNTGKALQIEWPIAIGSWVNNDWLPRIPVGGNGIADAVLHAGLQPTKTVTVVPIQMHFHVGSEHMIEGGFGGDVNFESCAAVFGTFLKVGNESSQDALINSFLDYMPSTAGGVSQTTPGCNEGVRWLVYEQPLTITPATLSRLYGATANTTVAGERQIYRTNNRLVQPIHGRPVWLSKSEDGSTQHAPLIKKIVATIQDLDAKPGNMGVH